SIVLNGDNLGFTSIVGTAQALRGAVALAGKQHFEITVGGTTASLGLANATESLAAQIGASGDSIGLRSGGLVLLGGGALGAAGFTFAAGDTIGIEVDVPNHLIYFMKGATRSAGFDFSPVAGVVYPAMSVVANGAVAQARFTPSGDGLHPVGPGAFDVNSYP